MLVNRACNCELATSLRAAAPLVALLVVYSCCTESMLASRLARFDKVIQCGGKVQLLRIAKEYVPVVLHRPVLVKIGLAGGAAFTAVCNAEPVKCMERSDGWDPTAGGRFPATEAPTYTVRSHTGADFEAGRVHPGPQVPYHMYNPTDGRERAGGSPIRQGATARSGGAVSSAGALGDEAGVARSPARSTRASPSHSTAASPRDERAAGRASSREADDELEALLRKPWRGQARQLKPVRFEVLAQFEERGVRVPKLDDGVMIQTVATKYWVKWDGEATAKTTTKLNITRLFEELLKSKHCDHSIKANLAKQMNKKPAKEFLAKEAHTALSPAAQQAESELQAKRTKVDGKAPSTLTCARGPRSSRRLFS